MSLFSLTILTLPGRRPWAIEIKRNLAPKPGKGFHSACADIDPEAKYVVYPGRDEFTVSNGVSAINVVGLAGRITE